MNSITTMEQAEAYSASHPTWLSHIYSIPYSDTTNRFKDIIEAPVMKSFHWFDINRNMNFIAKVIDTVTHRVWDGKYFYFETTNLDQSKIDSMIDEIFKKYNNGISFDSLINSYHTGAKYNDLEHVKKNDLIPELDEQTEQLKVNQLITAHSKGTNQQFFLIKTADLGPVVFRIVLVTSYID